MAKQTKVNLKDKELLELADRIAGLLGESDNKRAVFGIKAIIAIGGSNFALQTLLQAAKMERDGVRLKTNDGSRYRTRGGHFFKLAKTNMSGAQRYRFMSLTNPKKQGQKDRRVVKNGRR